MVNIYDLARTLAGDREPPKNSSGGYLTLCPCHADNDFSLSISPTPGGKLLFKCFGNCPQETLVTYFKDHGYLSSNGDGHKARRESLGEPVQVYPYLDAAGKLVFQVCRYVTPEGKTFRQRRPDGKGGWIWKMTGVKMVPYRLPELLKTETVFICEGEKDCDRLVALGLTATTNAGGASKLGEKSKWRSEYDPYFKGKAVVILSDNDDPGRAHAQNVATHLHGIAASVKVLELPDLPEKGDVSDWIKAGGTKEQLLALVEAAPEWKPETTPRIVISNRFLQDVSGDVIQALEAANCPPFIFVRSGMLSSIFKDEKSTPKIGVLNETQLRGFCARTANFFKETKKGMAATSPPVEAVKDILHLGIWPFPALESIVESPALRSDGSILDQPGYDPQTRLYYVKPENLSLPEIPEKPSSDDVDGYLGYLLEAVQDFPFVEDADRANALGLILTLPLRPAITGNVPMAVISAPAPGTGKSLLQDTVAIIGTGKGAPMAGLPSTDDEMRKFITSRLLAGDPFISFDNLEMPLWGPSLSRALTCIEWEDRVLGGNTTARLPQRAVWVANGNNLKLRGDLPRRTFPIRLDARLAKPWERENFKHRDLRAWVLKWRGDLLAAILTITRAWFVAGKPEPQKPVPVMGGFESWAQTIGGILAFAGVEGFLENLSQFHDEADIEGPEWEAFLTAWVEIIGEQGKTCQEVTAILKDHDEFAEILPENLSDVFKNPKKSFEKSLGRSLSGKEKRPYGDKSLALQRVGTHKRAILWKVAPLPTR